MVSPRLGFLASILRSGVGFPVRWRLYFVFGFGGGAVMAGFS